jgi:ParB family chromosome partitioning protein
VSAADSHEARTGWEDLTMFEKRPALGRGLSALIPESAPALDVTMAVEIGLLSPNKYQPRSHVDDARLDELARSIKANGVIQPIVVRRVGKAYEIIAGERRWRAAQLAGQDQVPVIVRDVPDEKLLEIALIENIQREDLNPIEEANAYRKLTEEFGLKQEEVAVAVGKDRSSVANYLRLLKLPAEVRADVAAGTLSMGHARAVLGLADAAKQRKVASEVVSRGLSVREAEALIKKMSLEGRSDPKAVRARAIDVHTRAAEERLQVSLGTRVRIVRKGKGGRIEVDFTSEDELHRIFEQLTQ